MTSPNSTNESVRQMLQVRPLTAFSVYTDVQVYALRDVAEEICRGLDTIFASDVLDGELFNRVYGRFWLWVLGAYEVVRTMSQAKDSFSPQFATRVNQFKSKMEVLRIRFAKQEYRRNRSPVRAELSVAGLDRDEKEFVYRVGDESYSIRKLLKDFESFVRNIAPDDIIRDHRLSETFQKNSSPAQARN